MLPEGATTARRTRRRQEAGLAATGAECGTVLGHAAGDTRWVGCQWLYEGYCGRQPAAATSGKPTAAAKQNRAA